MPYFVTDVRTLLAVLPVSRRGHVAAPKVVMSDTRVDADVMLYFSTGVRASPLHDVPNGATGSTSRFRFKFCT